MKIAIVVKSPSKFNFQKAFNLPDADVYHLTSNPDLKRVLKKDVDINIDVNKYDYVILVGSEAVKNFTKITSLTDYTGRLAKAKDDSYNKFIISISPAALSFKPELQQTFNDTLARIHTIIGGYDTTVNKIQNTIVPVLTEEHAISVLQNIKAGLALDTEPVLAFDTETSSLYCRKGHVLGLSLSHTIDFGTYIHSDALSDKCIAIVQSMLDDPRISIVGHNAKFDMHFTKYHFNFNFDKAFEEGRMHDTLVLHYLLDERQGSHGLKSLAIKYTDLGDYDAGLDEFKKNYCKDYGIKEADFTYDLIPWEIIYPYAATDTIATIRLFKKFHPIVMANEKLSNVYTTIMMPCIELLQEIEDNGVPVSLPRLYKARELLNKEIQESTKELYTYPSVLQFEKDHEKIFNPGSPLQLRTLLFDYEKLKPTGKLTNTGAISTDAEVLEQLSEKSQLARVILNIRKSTKLLNTFVEKMIDNVDNDGRLRTGFNATSTTSGRLSSSGTINLQQLPSRTYLIKGCIKARPGYKLIAADLSTAEIYFSAAISKDPLMMQMFKDIYEHPELSADFHSLTAFNVFPTGCKSPLEVKLLAPHYRQASKSINYSGLIK